jgi:hypothetical protein
MCILLSAVNDAEEVVEVVILLLTMLHHTGVNMGDGRLHLIGKRYNNNNHHCVQY